ncbi:MAG TPA: hypothetical protein VKT33_07865 [Candidatus Angelobacter sp.]|nr:hypothetical protein [Candidatus Angelobacter sp.]
MERNESISERLLSRLPQPANMADYQAAVASLLAENERKLRRNKWTVVRVWLFIVIVSGPFLWMAGTHFNTAEGNWFLGLAGFWVLFGAIEIAKYEHNQGRVELLRELKQVQLRIFELHARIGKGGTPMPDKG